MENDINLKRLAAVAEAAAAIRKEEKEKEKEKKAVPFQITVNRTPIDIFRYLLAGLLITVKLGLFTYLSVNPLANVSWWLVLLPAYVIEAGLLAFVVALGATAAIIGLFAVLWVGFKYIVIDPLKRRRFNKKLGGDPEAHFLSSPAEVNLMAELQKVMGNDASDETLSDDGPPREGPPNSRPSADRPGK